MCIGVLLNPREFARIKPSSEAAATPHQKDLSSTGGYVGRIPDMYSRSGEICNMKFLSLGSWKAQIILYERTKDEQVIKSRLL